MSDNTLSGGTESEKTTSQSTASDDNATPVSNDTKPEPEGKKPLSENELDNALKTPEKVEVSSEQRERDRSVREAKFKLQYVAKANEVTAAMNEGKTLDEALDGVPLNIADKIRKDSRGHESFQDTSDFQADPEEIAKMVFQKERAKDSLKSSLREVDSSTAQNAIDKFNELSKTLNPEDAAKYALLDAGVIQKQAAAEAYNEAKRDKGLAPPPHGGNPQVPEPKAASVAETANKDEEDISFEEAMAEKEHFEKS